MKRNILTVIAVLGLLGILAQRANATDWIINSAHNFSTNGWNTTEICKPCHTPHNAPNPASVSKAMWNHTLTNASYIMPGGTPGTAVNDLDKVSRLCLSCHDGTVALDSFGGGPAAPGAHIPARYQVGLDMSTNHPIGIAAVVTDETGAFKPVNYTAGTVGAGTSTLPLYDNGKPARVIGTTSGGAQITRTNYVVSCNSCHDVHGQGIDPRGGVDLYSTKLLRVSMQNSALCVTCHNQ